MSIDMTLESIGHGALSEKFDDALIEVIKNSCDPNTDATTKRKLVIELTFTPDKNDRGSYGLQTKVTTKLGPVKPLVSMVSMGFDSDTGEVAATEHVMHQQSLFDKSPNAAPVEAKLETKQKVVGIR